ncbi:MAG: hypothetical protein DRJ61_16980 [Acidobacteria bacterium]|nr:MAG: hypothetical protein DRJ61_16980 [Acidobacteriota bacterium]
MATAAIIDLDINEGDTFVMSLDFWSDVDNTIPIDITADTFKGSMKIGTKTIPMTIRISTVAVNSIQATIAYQLMGDLSKAGKYDIDQLTNSGENYRIVQGDVRVNAEVTK